MRRFALLCAGVLWGCSSDAPSEPSTADAADGAAPIDTSAPGDTSDAAQDGAASETASDAGRDVAGEDVGADGAVSCGTSSFALCEDFETTAVGAIPAGWTKTGIVAVASTDAHRGAHSLELGVATSGPRRIRRSASILGAMASDHWGRIFYKVKLPAPAYSGYLHSTLVAMQGKSPVDGVDIEARLVDTVQGPSGTHQFLYNVQPSSRAEFGKGSAYDWKYDDKWHCAEWHVVHATQSYAFFIDGVEVRAIRIDAGAGKYANVEIPASYDSLSVGWNNYQDVGSGGFKAWVDDLAIDGTQIGCAR